MNVVDLRNRKPGVPEDEAMPGNDLGGSSTNTPRFGKKEKFIIGVIALFFLCAFYITLDASKYRATVRVIEGEGQIGVNPTTEVLDFGDLSRGTTAVRRVDIQNGTGIALFVAVARVGKIFELVDLDKNYFTVAPHTSDRIDFSLRMPASATIDATYGGRVYIFKIPIFIN